MQFLKLRGAVTAAAMMFVGLCGATPSAAWAEAPGAVPAVEAATSVPASALSGSAWISQGTVLDPAAPKPAAAPTPVAMALATGALHVDSLAELVSDMPSPASMTDDLKCLAQAVYFESRGEPIEGQLAVAEVVINRARSGIYPSSYCDVITQPAQFSFVRHGVIPTADETSAAWQRAQAIAEIAQQNLWQTKAADALYFHATYVNPSWRRQKQLVAQIDTHIFYR